MSRVPRWQRQGLPVKSDAQRAAERAERAERAEALAARNEAEAQRLREMGGKPEVIESLERAAARQRADAAKARGVQS